MSDFLSCQENKRMISCPNLAAYYSLPIHQKEKYLFEENVRLFFQELVSFESGDIVGPLKNAFWTGRPIDEVPGGLDAGLYLCSSSWFVKELIRNPGSSSALEKIYLQERLSGAMDMYFREASSARALINRLQAVIENSKEYCLEYVRKTDRDMHLLNLGSGPGRDVIKMSEDEELIRERTTIDCVDIDQWAIDRGKELVAKSGIDNVRFIQKDFRRLGHLGLSDYELVIGILCPLSHENGVALLRKFRKYLKPGARILAACLLEEMLEKDFFTAWLIYELTDWKLNFRRSGQLRKMFEEAGFVWLGSFTEKKYSGDTEMYEIGIGEA